MTIKRLSATRYVLPLREGGSLPAIIDTEDGQYVVKFRGAGQGPKALVAELIAAGIAQAVGLSMPDAAVIDLKEGFGLNEPDPEIQDLLKGSVGENFGLRYLPGAFGYEPAADRDSINTVAAAAIVWFDALISNVDRTANNPNLLLWGDRVWLIDHGASLYFHHAPGDWSSRSQERFALIRQHILLDQA
ncbi:MAG: HipA family kinase, partial [Dehalococcoidia bacterium]